MSMYGSYKTDPEKEQNGEWFEAEDFRILLARAGGANKKYDAAMEKMTRSHRRSGNIPLSKMRSLLKGIYSKVVVKNWQVLRDGKWVDGIEAEDGSLLEVTEENILQTFRKLDDLFAEVHLFAEQGSNYSMENDSKNS